jgi:subtilisin family serine protease
MMRVLLLLFAGVLVVGSSPRFASVPAIVVDPQNRQCINDGRYIVSLKDQADREVLEAYHAKPLYQGATKSLSLEKPIFVVQHVSEHQVANLSNMPDIDYIEPDCRVQMQNSAPRRPSGRVGHRPQPPSDPFYPDQWGFQRINGHMAWYYTQGEGVLVGLCDSGVDFNHPDLEGREAMQDGHSLSFDATSLEFSVTDTGGHGTHVAGVIAANASEGVGIAGLAPKAKLVSGKVFTGGGWGYRSWLARCLRRMIEYKVATINLSVGGDYGITVHRVARRAMDEGITLVLAAGNGGSSDRWPDMINSFPGLIKVAALANTNDGENRLASFSNRGDWIDIVAPGEDILSGVLDLEWEFHNGTSMAAPHVTGIVALMKSVYPSISDPEIIDFIRYKDMNNSNDLEDLFEFVGENYVVINAYTSVKLAHDWARYYEYYPAIPSDHENQTLRAGIRIVEDTDAEVKVFGWAYDPDREDFPSRVSFQIKPGGADQFVTIATTDADQCDEWLVSEGIAPTCHHSFSFTIPKTPREGSYEFRVLAEDVSTPSWDHGTSSELVELDREGQSIFAFEAEEGFDGSPTVGEIEEIEISDDLVRIKGWAWDPDRDNYFMSDWAFNNVHLFYRPKCPKGEACEPFKSASLPIWANRERQDLVDAGLLEDPFHGFEIGIPIGPQVGAQDNDYVVVTEDFLTDGFRMLEMFALCDRYGNNMFTEGAPDGLSKQQINLRKSRTRGKPIP